MRRRSAARVVRTGFGISALYNLFGISIAAAGLLSPVVCAILMPLSSVTIVVFTTGATAWLGSKLSDGALGVESSNVRGSRLATFNPQRAAKEAA